MDNAGMDGGRAVEMVGVIVFLPFTASFDINLSNISIFCYTLGATFLIFRLLVAHLCSKATPSHSLSNSGHEATIPSP